MTVDEIRDLFDYNAWANRRLLLAAEAVTPAVFTAPTPFSFGSLRNTLLHILDSEYGWRWLMLDKGFAPALQPDDFPNVAALRQRWDAENAEMRAFLDGLQDADLATIVRYPGDGGVMRERVLWHCLFHVVNHGMQHRSEAAAILTTYDHSPGDLDFTLFLNERRPR